jgi:DnaJ-class molecular chaperone
MGGGRGGARRGEKAAKTAPSVVQLPVTLEELYVGKEKKLETERARTCGTCSG